MAKRGIHGQGGMCGKGGVCMVKGGMCGEGGVCVAKGERVWQRGGMCGKGGPAWRATPHEIQPVNARAVRILLECILVLIMALYDNSHEFV